MRALAVLPELVQRHEVLILAGSDAYRALWPDYTVTRIQTIRYHHGRSGRISNWRTARSNLSAVLDSRLFGPGLEMVCDILSDFRPDIILTDSELFTHRAARRLKIPRITFDHFGLLVYCRPEVGIRDRIALWGNARVYKALFGQPDRAVVTGFFQAPAICPGVRVVGPVIRREVRETPASRGEYLLVYLSQGQFEFTPQIERALLELDIPIKVYGTPRRGIQNNLQFKPTANLPFIEDLARCRAVFATAGNQLSGEVIYFGKPMLAIPMACMEQRLNAIMIERMGVGMYARRGQITGKLLREFLAREEEFASAARREFHDGAREAIEAVEQSAEELLTGRNGGTTARATAP
jgi:uncharacterized protein (TIGR00661 family)